MDVHSLLSCRVAGFLEFRVEGFPAASGCGRRGWSLKTDAGHAVGTGRATTRAVNCLVRLKEKAATFTASFSQNTALAQCFVPL